MEGQVDQCRLGDCLAVQGALNKRHRQFYRLWDCGEQEREGAGVEEYWVPSQNGEGVLQVSPSPPIRRPLQGLKTSPQPLETQE